MSCAGGAWQECKTPPCGGVSASLVGRYGRRRDQGVARAVFRDQLSLRGVPSATTAGRPSTVVLTR